ncbi:hypothetical protein AWM75_02050 [Aerococcus urinaehominis]|uniref:Uncharacterized protein n=1 Tax=Aerococcus urinaehominis TaxID=128944 RepID=A0A0X8FK79_9LACT|nr:MFS transporter [Aerococcus urinaehominis]AMB98848.1 hypothetical protein AWM75_02050 [Aerococcus urinaehominis]SDM17388.1 Predicted arabinose efflux permease, MFS family [Aerococcus urinaehominis]
MKTNKMPWPSLLLLAFVACIAMISELLPAGFLQEMAGQYQVPLGQMSLFIGTYAIMSAVVGIPVTRLFSHVNRRYYLIAVCLAYAAANFVIAWAPNFILAFVARLVAGSSAGALWAMLGSYPVSFLPHHLAGRGTTIVLGGVTIGLSIGLPLATAFAKAVTWQAGFMLVASLFTVCALLGLKLFPSVAGEAYSAENNYLILLKNKDILIVSLVTILLVLAHYMSYIYIQLISEQAGVAVGSAQLAFGVGALVSIFVVARFIDQRLHGLAIAIAILAGLALLILNVLSQSSLLVYLAFVMWGLSFAPMTTVLQTACTQQVDRGKALANSLSATSYDIAIMLGSMIGGLTLTAIGLSGTLYLSIAVFILASVVIYKSPRTFTNK